MAGIDSRADKTTIRDNYIEDADGAGVRLGGHKVDGHQYGVDNLVSANHLPGRVARVNYLKQQKGLFLNALSGIDKGALR